MFDNLGTVMLVYCCLMIAVAIAVWELAEWFFG